jgi:hypothetical protein
MPVALSKPPVAYLIPMIHPAVKVEWLSSFVLALLVQIFSQIL